MVAHSGQSFVLDVKANDGFTYQNKVGTAAVTLNILDQPPRPGADELFSMLNADGHARGRVPSDGFSDPDRDYAGLLWDIPAASPSGPDGKVAALGVS